MLLQALGLMGASHSAVVAPSVSSLSVTLQNSGTCSGKSVGTPASVRGTFAIANPDWVNYKVNVYVNGVLKTTLTAAGTTHYDFNLSGLVYSGSSPHNVTTTFKLDVVRVSGGFVAGTRSQSYTDEFGGCSGPL